MQPVTTNLLQQLQLNKNITKAEQKTSVTNSPNVQPKTQPKSSYNDPLLKFPVRGLAYSNEIGAALSEVSPKLGTLLWVPALMYFGADIYDKYKNENDLYKPSGQRGTEQAIFQACSSVVLPTAAVHLGQKVASAGATFTKTGLSAQAREDATRFTLNFMEREKLKDYVDNVDTYKMKLNEELDNFVAGKKSENIITKPIKKIIDYFDKKGGHHLSASKQDKLHAYVNNQVDQIFEMRKSLMQNKKPEKMSKKIFNGFLKSQGYFKQKYGDDFLIHAAKSALKKHEKSIMFKQKILKTIGGFIALGLLIKPIDNFVENKIMKKVVEPGFKCANSYFTGNNVNKMEK